MFWNGKYSGIYEMINTKYLKKPQYFKTDAGCEHEYETVVVEVRPKGKTFEVKTVLFRSPSDVMTKSLQPIWDNKDVQKRLKKDRENEEKGIEKKYKPTKYRDLTRKDYRDLLLSHLIFYKWLKENVKDDYPDFDRIKGAINVLDFAYEGKANVLNKLYENDINTFDDMRIDGNIAQLTMTKNQYIKYAKDWRKRIDKSWKERRKEEKAPLKGLVCHKCNMPMVQFEEFIPFSGKGHSMNARLDGTKCPKCGFIMYTSGSAQDYIRQNNWHYILFSDAEETVPKENLTKEIINMRQAVIDGRKESDKLWDRKHGRDEKILESIREANKKRTESKYFGSMESVKNGSTKK
jgi:hypothetical protein